MTGIVDFSGIFVLKLSSSGSLFWQHSWFGFGSAGSDSEAKIVAESSGSVFVSSTGHGLTPPNTRNSSAVLLKFNSTGALEWQKMWGGIGMNNDGINAISSDLLGNVYVTGYANDNANGSSVYGIPIMKLNPNGTIAWQRLWLRSMYNSGIAGNGLSLDSSGRIFITGSAISSALRNSSFLLLELSPQGGSDWQSSAGASSADSGKDVAIDPFGDPVAVGSVMEGPPYGLTLQSYPIIASNYTIQLPIGGLIRSPIGYLLAINETVLPAYGSQKYSGGNDAYILKVSPPRPSPPSPPIALATVVGRNNITLSWNRPEYSGGYPIIGYHLYRGISSRSESLFTNITNAQSFTDYEVKTGVTYYYYVKAVNLLGESDASNENHAAIGAVSGIVIDPAFLIGVSGLLVGLTVLLFYGLRRRVPNHQHT